MRIVTVRQPWAWAIVHGGKNVENRVRNIAGSYRGQIAVHAAKANDVDAWRAMGKTNLAAYSRALDARESLIGGAIIGVVDLVDVWSSKQTLLIPFDCFARCTPVGAICSPWAQNYLEFPAHRGYHLVLANPRPLAEPIPYRGALGLRMLDAETVARIEAAIA